MGKVNVLDAIDRLTSTINKVEDFDLSSIDLSERVLDNRIITLEGYIRFIENEAIPKLTTIRNNIEKQVGGSGD
ncbi:MAG TPA: hypothetical protein GXZ20_02400 [Halanaerobiaceae bacterium]|jgi:hypothetical protein|nr:hypothetical protein [Bacillota bacterium]HHU91975.1 hypothetical protein [Halanaerobiaceae bacterium]HOA40847.1 hypothetical protein [Halanaerobiales bacterium]HPZ62956.1 hypothetical protein [Halanaerobiales bacterium]HQD04139.1 hypothetical protein [Halanaerobiales bacterium]